MPRFFLDGRKVRQRVSSASQFMKDFWQPRVWSVTWMRSRLPCAVLMCCAAVQGLACVVAADWPHYRGQLRDGHAASSEKEIKSLPLDLRPVWKLKVGSGFASPILAEGRLVFVDENEGQETAHLVQAGTGKEIWRRAYGEAFADEWGLGPRCTPVLDGDRLYVQSCKGEFQCLSLKDGSTQWRFSFEKDYGVQFVGKVEVPEAAARRRGHSGSPVIEGDRIVVAVGNTTGASLVGFNKMNGKVLWKSQSDEAAYSTLITATLCKTPQVVAYTADSLLGLRLEDGELLWRVPLKTAAKRHAVTPIIQGNRIIVSSHSLGLLCFEVTPGEQAPKLAVTEAWSNRDLKISLASLVLVDGRLYGQGPDKNFVCVDSNNGRVLWSQPGFSDKPLTGYTSSIAVGKNLLALTEQGQLVLIAAEPGAYRELGRLQVCGKNWSHPAYVGGVLYLRDYKDLIALGLGDESR